LPLPKSISDVDIRPEEILTISRRLIGRRFDDPTVKKDIESWPFKIVDQGGNPFVEVEYLGETKTFSPQEISSMVLMKVRLIAMRRHYWIVVDKLCPHR
jgi:L1 cell adhesion molecule like protein